MNRKIITYVIGKLLVIEAGLLILPLMVALIYQESLTHILAFVYTIGLLIVLGILMSYRAPNYSLMRAKEGAVIVALGWLLLSFFGSLPFVFSGDITSLVDAFFETASGFSTTGSSILSSLSSLAHSTLFWRSFTHLVGGMGVLVFTLAILPEKSDSAQLLRAEVSGPVFGKIVSRARDSARILYTIYVIFTVIFIAILMIGGGVPLFDAMLLSFGTAGTGGFSINDLGFSIYGNPIFVEYAISIGMLIFGINFNLYFFILIGHIKEVFKDEELRWYIGIVASSVVIIMLNTFSMATNIETHFRQTLFTVSSIITTTGYATTDFAQWPLLSQLVIMGLMFIGGCAGSTAGGIKVSRIAIYIKQAITELLRVGNTNRVVSLRFNYKSISNKEVLKILNYLMVYIIGFILILFSVSIETNDFTTAFTSVATTFNNIGPGLGAVGPTQNFGFYSDWNKIVLTLSMIAGRLEIYPILILFAPSTIKKLTRIKYKA